MEPHIDSAPYVEQTLADVLADLDDASKPPQVAWTCPICKGAQQTERIEKTDVVRAVGEPSWLDVVCQCGHTHGGHQGCGFGFQVEIPASVLENLG